MYGCFTSLVVFGWRQGDRESCLEEAWLEDMGVERYFLDVVRLHAGEVVYGAECVIDETDGRCSLDDADAVERVRRAHVRARACDAAVGPLGFFCVLAGDAELGTHARYAPGD